MSNPKVQFERNNLFATPDSIEALQETASLYSGSERTIAILFMFMTWNLVCKILEDEEAVAQSFNEETLTILGEE